MKITMLGTGHAMVDNCFNTCFIIENNGQLFLVDTGGGYEILPRIKKAGYSFRDIHDVFITHEHTDHITGLMWLFRQFVSLSYKDPDVHLNIYGHHIVINIAETMFRLLFSVPSEKLINTKVFFHTVNDRETISIIGNDVTFFDAHAIKVLQYGFLMKDSHGHKIVCCGDEPLAKENEDLAEGCDLLMHETFCLSAEEDVFHPRFHGHSVVIDAAETAQRLNVKRLLMYHTEDRHMETRKERYTAEGRQSFSGTIYVPDDLETIVIPEE
ncbi:MAG: MBL fold metallo-hydrolase [Erysipelotrichaceae bacterium]|nr:MBL fold metallo-hydrolase [Erysipelotrichaceae bacterium]